MPSTSQEIVPLLSVFAKAFTLTFGRSCCSGGWPIHAAMRGDKAPRCSRQRSRKAWV